MANIVIPPWLEPQPIPQLYAQGMNTGIAAAAQQNEAMQAAARLAQQNAELQQKAISSAAELGLTRYIADQRSAQAALDSQIDQQRVSAMSALKEQELMQRAAMEASRLENAERSLVLREAQAKDAMQNRSDVLALRERMADWRMSQPANLSRLDPIDSIDYRNAVEALERVRNDWETIEMHPEVITKAEQNVQKVLDEINKKRSAAQASTVPAPVQPGNIPVPVPPGGGIQRFVWDNRVGDLVPATRTP